MADESSNTPHGPSSPESAQSRKLSSEEIASYSSQARRGFIWILSTTVLWQIISWVLTLLTARILRPEDYGLLALTEAIFPYLGMVAVLKLDSWLIQVDDFSESKQSAIFSLLLALGVLTTVVGLLGSIPLAHFYGHAELVLPFQVTALVFLPRALRVLPEARLRRKLSFEQIAISNLVVGILRGALQLALAYLGFSYWSLVIGNVFGEILATLWLVVVAGLPRSLGYDAALFRAAVLFGVSATGSTIFWVIFSTADNLVVGKLFGVEVLGYYSMAFFLTELPMGKINSVLMPVISPYYSKLKHNVQELYDTFLRLNRVILSLLAPTLVGLLCVAPEVVPVFLGPHWVPLTVPLQVMCLVGLLRGSTANVSALLLAIGKANHLLVCSAIPALVMPGAFYVWGSAYGVQGVYAAWLTVFPIVGPLLLLQTLALISGRRLVVFLVNLVPPIVAAFGMYVMTSEFRSMLLASMPVYFQLILEILFGVVVYAGILRFLFRGTWDELFALLKRPKS